MTETLPDFDIPMTVPEAPAPKKARRKPTKKRSPRSAPPERAAKPARVVKRRKMKRPGFDRRTKAFRQASAAKQSAPANPALTAGHIDDLFAARAIFKKYNADGRRTLIGKLLELLT